MRIAVLLGAFSLGPRPLDKNTAYTSPRGLTGTELAFMRVSEELRKRGHHVHQYLGDNVMRPEWETFDSVLNFNEPNLFVGLKSPRKILYMMLNDFSFVRPGFDAWVHEYVGVCQQHADYVAKVSATEGRWSVVPLGCDPQLYTDGLQVPGRVLWCSSADRGLHWLLQIWPTIRAAVPHATLRVLYHWSYDGLEHVTATTESSPGRGYHEHTVEMAQRVRYMRHAIDALRPFGVEHVRSVSRERMVTEWNEASVFAFPCDTIAFSEGFSVSTLEAHASYTVPVITDQDCLGGIYADSGAVVVPSPVRDNLDRFADAVIDALRTGRADPRCREFALRHTWSSTAEQLEALLK